MSQKKLLIIANPSSGKAKMRTNLMSVVEIFSNDGYEVTVYPTKERADATKRAEAVLQDEFDLIVVCGGDGTLNEVITGLMHTGVKCKLGYIPAGTLNEWSQGLGIARTITKAAKDIISGEELTLDIGKFGDKYFSYTASFGAFTSASYTTPQNVKNVLGQAAYLFEGMKSLANVKPYHLKVTAEDRSIEGDFVFGAVSNSMSMGGIVKFNESSVKLNDGLLEVLLFRNPPNIVVFQNMVDGIIKKDFERDGIEFFHTDKITVECSENLAWTLDGEFAQGSEKLVISNVHNAITLLVPKK